MYEPPVVESIEEVVPEPEFVEDLSSSTDVDEPLMMNWWKKNGNKHRNDRSKRLRSGFSDS